MSRSKRTARSENNSPRPKKGIFTRPEGGIRTGWLLAASLFACAFALQAVRLGALAALAALLRVWNVNADTAARAPAWARWIYAWQGSLAGAVASGVLLMLCKPLGSLWQCDAQAKRTSLRAAGLAALSGLGLALLAAALSLLPDSSRMNWPLAAPRFSPAQPVLILTSLLDALAEEAFTKRVLFDGLEERWGRARATAIACAVFFVIGGGYAGNLPCAANVLLLGLLGCVAYRRFGLCAAVGLRWAFGATLAVLLGFGGADAAVYRLYGVSEVLLTGGDAGPMYGLWQTLLLALAIALLERGAAARFLRRRSDNRSQTKAAGSK